MQGILAMILTGISLGTIGMFIKLIDNNVHYMTVNFLRIFLGFLFLLIFVPIIDKTTFKVKKSDLKEYALIGLLFAISISLYTTAISFTTIQAAVMINYSYPIFMLFFGYMLLKESIDSTKLTTLFIALIGILIINPLNSAGNSTGNILAIISAITYALLIVMMRKEDKNHSIGAVVWFLGFASLFMIPIPFIYGFEGIKEVLPYILGLGIISTGIAYFFYNLGLEKIEAEYGAVITMIVGPLVSIALAIFIINEELSIRTIIGGSVLILAGFYMNLANKIKFKSLSKNILKLKNK